MIRFLPVLFLFVALSSCSTSKHTNITVAGHRGEPVVRPENTLSSFEAAIKDRAHAIEFDIQISKDGIPVIIHDQMVDRTTNGRGLVNSLRFDQLRALNAGSAFRPRFKGARIPTLLEVLQLAKQHQLLIYPEIKGYRTPEDIKIMIKQILNAGFEDHAVVESFH